MSDSQLASFSVSKAVGQFYYVVLSQSVRRSVTQFVNRKSFSQLVHVSQLLTQLVSNCYFVDLLVCWSSSQSVSQYFAWSDSQLTVTSQ